MQREELHRAKESKMFSLVEKSMLSDLGMREFCRVHSVSPGCFYYWKKKYEKIQVSGSDDKPIESPESVDFIPLTFTDTPSPAPLTKIRYPNGVEIELSSADIPLLKNLIKIY